MPDDRKKISGMDSPEVTYAPKPLFSSRNATARPTARPMSVAPLFSGGTTGKPAEPGTVPSPKPLMAQAVVRVRVTVTVEELQRTNPGAPAEICQTATRLIEVARLEAEFVEGTVTTWGTSVMERLSALTARANELIANSIHQRTALDLGSTADALEQLVVKHMQPQNRLMMVLRGPVARREAFDLGYATIEKQLRTLAEDERQLAEQNGEFVKLTQDVETCVDDPTVTEVAGRYLAHVLRSRTDPDESRGFAVQLEERIVRLSTTKRELHIALRTAWLRQEVIRKIVQMIRNLLEEAPAWRERCVAIVSGNADASRREQLVTEIQERISGVRILVSETEEL